MRWGISLSKNTGTVWGQSFPSLLAAEDPGAAQPAGKGLLLCKQLCFFLANKPGARNFTQMGREREQRKQNWEGDEGRK